jgi:hypothetical protein
VFRSEDRVRPYYEVEHVGKSVGCIDAPVAARLNADPQAARRGRKCVDRRLGGVVRSARDAELVLVPQVDARFVADLDIGG